MLRITELKLPLGHAPEALAATVCARLGIAPPDLLDLAVVRCADDARRTSAVRMVYAVDVTVADEAAVLVRCSKRRDVGVPPDTGYRLVTRAPPDHAGLAR